MSRSLPLIVITQGDPAGVGPETIVGAWTDPAVHAVCRPVAVGHPELLRRAARLLGASLQVRPIASLDEASPSPGELPCLAVVGDEALRVKPRTIDPRAGQAAYDALLAAARATLSGAAAALVTAPLHKAALWSAGHHYPGHTELLAELCGVDDFAMMLYLGPEELPRSAAGLAVVHVTLHMALREVFDALTVDAVLAKARLVSAVMARLKGSLPRVGVCALNPHAGEQGLFGDEELRIIDPAVRRGAGEGLDLMGPFPADTLIARARQGEFDAVVAMYHDQGHIAIKLLAMHRAVNVTLGLPIVRTSVAHGTAFDRAWSGRAEHGGLVAAIRAAARLVDGQNTPWPPSVAG